jgi:hypothetical protein
VRADVSFPEHERGVLGRAVDTLGVDDSLFRKNRLLIAQHERFGRLWYISDGFDPEFGWSAVESVGWAAYLAGARGLEIRDALGKKGQSEEAHAGSFLLPRREDSPDPGVSLRLKSARRLQQDIEWAEQWVSANGERSIPRGYLLASLGMEFAQRAHAAGRRVPSLLPLVEFPGRLDTIALEEIRRALRAESARIDH